MQRVDYVIMGAVALILLFGGLLFLPRGPSEFTLNSAHADGCKELKTKYSCDQYAVTKITSFTSGNSVYTLGNVCATKGYTDTSSCARSCNCIVTGQAAALNELPVKTYSSNPIVPGIIEDDVEEETAEEPQGEEYYGV